MFVTCSSCLRSLPSAPTPFTGLVMSLKDEQQGFTSGIHNRDPYNTLVMISRIAFLFMSKAARAESSSAVMPATWPSACSACCRSGEICPCSAEREIHLRVSSRDYLRNPQRGF